MSAYEAIYLFVSVFKKEPCATQHCVISHVLSLAENFVSDNVSLSDIRGEILPLLLNNDHSPLSLMILWNPQTQTDNVSEIQLDNIKMYLGGFVSTNLKEDMSGKQK